MPEAWQTYKLFFFCLSVLNCSSNRWWKGKYVNLIFEITSVILWTIMKCWMNWSPFGPSGVRAPSLFRHYFLSISNVSCQLSPWRWSWGSKMCQTVSKQYNCFYSNIYCLKGVRLLHHSPLSVVGGSATKCWLTDLLITNFKKEYEQYHHQSKERVVIPESV